MAVKDVVKYYKEVSKQYFDMIDELKDLEKEASQNLVTPEQVDQMKTMIEPLRGNYMTLAWVMHLLKQPTKKKKKYLYNKKRRMFTETLDKARSKEAVIDEGKQVIADIKDVFKA